MLLFDEYNSNGEEAEVNLLDWEESEEDLLALIPCNQLDERAFYPFLTSGTAPSDLHCHSHTHHPIQSTHSFDLSTIHPDNHSKGDKATTNMTVIDDNLLKNSSMLFRLSSDSFEYIPGASIKPCYSRKVKNKTMRFASSKNLLPYPSSPSADKKKEEIGGFKRALNFARQFLLDGNGFTFRRQQENSVNNNTVSSSKVDDSINHLPSLVNNGQDNEATIKEKTMTAMSGSASIASHSITLPQLLTNLSLSIPMLSSPRATITQDMSDSKHENNNNNNHLPVVESSQPSSSETVRGTSLLATGISLIERLLSPRASARKTTKSSLEQSVVDKPITPTVVVVPTTPARNEHGDNSENDHSKQDSSHLVPSPPKNSAIPSSHSHGHSIRRASLISSVQN